MYRIHTGQVQGWQCQWGSWAHCRGKRSRSCGLTVSVSVVRLASCQREVSETDCVRFGRGRPQSYLHASGSWRRPGPGEMADCSRSPSQQSEWHADHADAPPLINAPVHIKTSQAPHSPCCSERTKCPISKNKQGGSSRIWTKKCFFPSPHGPKNPH